MACITLGELKSPYLELALLEMANCRESDFSEAKETVAICGLFLFQDSVYGSDFWWDIHDGRTTETLA